MAAGREKLSYQELINYQRAKLAGTVGDVIFVGDSSLGNALDAKLWTSLSGRSATNLALSGSYGYAGSLVMIESVVKRHRPTDVIIMQTAEMMMRSSTVESVPPLDPPLDPPRGIAERLERLQQFWLDNMNLEQLQASFKFVSKWARGELSAPSVIKHDYIKQRGTTQPVPTVAHFDVTKDQARQYSDPPANRGFVPQGRA